MLAELFQYVLLLLLQNLRKHWNTVEHCHEMSDIVKPIHQLLNNVALV